MFISQITPLKTDYDCCVRLVVYDSNQFKLHCANALIRLVYNSHAQATVQLVVEF